MYRACSTGAAAHEGEPVHRVEGASLFAEARGGFAGVRGCMKLIERVVFQLPGGVSVWHVDALLPHALAELLRVVAQRTLEEVAGGEGQGAQAAAVKDTVAAVVLDGIAGELELVPADHAGLVFEVAVLERVIVSVAEGIKGAQELGQAATLDAARQVEDPSTSWLCTIDAGIAIATVPAFLSVWGGESEIRKRDFPGDQFNSTHRIFNQLHSVLYVLHPEPEDALGVLAPLLKRAGQQLK